MKYLLIDLSFLITSEERHLRIDKDKRCNEIADELWNEFGIDVVCVGETEKNVIDRFRKHGKTPPTPYTFFKECDIYPEAKRRFIEDLSECEDLKCMERIIKDMFLKREYLRCRKSSPLIPPPEESHDSALASYCKRRGCAIVTCDALFPDYHGVTIYIDANLSWDERKEKLKEYLREMRELRAKR